MRKERQVTISELEGVDLSPDVQNGFLPDEAQIEAVEAQRLSPEEEQRKQAYEAVFAVAFAGDYARMLVVKLFKKERLYRNEYPTWEEYCEKKLEKTARRIDQLIKAAEVVRNIQDANSKQVSEDVPGDCEEEKQVSEITLPNVRQASELAQLGDPAEQVEVWTEVAGRGDPITAQVVAAAVEAFQAKKVYPFLGGSEWSDDDVRRCADYLDGRSSEERDVLSSLLSSPHNNAESVRRQLLNFEIAPPEAQAKILTYWQSEDPADRAWVIQRLDAEAPRPIDKRTIPLKYADRYVKEAIDAYPDDSSTVRLRQARAAIRDVLGDIRRKEGERNDDREERAPDADDEAADRGEVQEAL